MSRAEISHQISSYQKRIAGCNEEIQALQKQLQKLSSLDDQHQKARRQLKTFQTDMIGRNKNLGMQLPQMRFAQQQSQSMLELVQGAKARRAEDGMDDSLRKIRRESERVKQKIADLNRDIRRYENIIADLRRQMAALPV
jgi:chromosome segregation ATPase